MLSIQGSLIILIMGRSAKTWGSDIHLIVMSVLGQPLLLRCDAALSARPNLLSLGAPMCNELMTVQLLPPVSLVLPLVDVNTKAECLPHISR